jgi:hypothetical protein
MLAPGFWLQQLGKIEIAILRHRLQSELDKSGVHCARLYKFRDLVKYTSSTANFLPPEVAIVA